MKKLLLVLLLFFVAGSTFAGSKDIFSINEDLVYAEMSDLVELESYVVANNVTLSSMTEANHSLASNLAATTGVMGVNSFMEPPLGIPSFIWGCCLSVAGVAVVYFVAEDQNETKKALWGCLVNGVGYVGFYIVYFIIILGYYGY
jgi:hypothetical protein